MSATPIEWNGHLDRLMVALRAYAEPSRHHRGESASGHGPSEWTLVFDTETGTGPGQPLRFGSYQVRRSGVVYEAGLFYRPEVMPPDEVAMLDAYAGEHGLMLRTQTDFVTTVFYGIGYELRATIVGFNLPFDLSRLAIRHGSARGNMRGGFSFTLSADKRLPAVRVKHLSRRASFVKFAAPFRQRTGRSDRRRGRRLPPRAGHFLDANTLAHALLSRSFSLSALAEHLGTDTRKADTDEHGGPLTAAYIAYAVQDVETTWVCYAELNRRYGALRLSGTAHIGKEADRWEEQFFIGADPDAPVEYGSAPRRRYELADELESAAVQVGQRELAGTLGVARETLRRLLAGDRRPVSARTRNAVARGLTRFYSGHAHHDTRRREALHWTRSEIERRGLTGLADRIGCDPSNLAKALDGRRPFGGTIAAGIMRLMDHCSSESQ